MKLVKRVDAIFDHVIDSLAILGAVLIAGMMLIVCTEVMMRYFLHRPQLWVVETAETFLLWFTFLSAAWILKREGHVTVDVLVRQLSPRIQALLAIISSILGVIICSLLIPYGISIAWYYFQKDICILNSVSYPLGPIIAIIPICSILLGIQFMRRGYGYLQSWRSLSNKEPTS